MWPKTNLPQPAPVGAFGISWPWLVIPHPCRGTFNFYVVLGPWVQSTLAYTMWTCEHQFLCSTTRRVAVSSMPSTTVRDPVLSPTVLEFPQFGRGVSLAAVGHSERKTKSSVITHGCFHWLLLEYHYYVSAACLQHRMAPGCSNNHRRIQSYIFTDYH